MGQPDAYAPCPCGSGKRYKFCCYQKERELRSHRQAQPIWERRQPAADNIVYVDLEEGGRQHGKGMRLLGNGEVDKAMVCFQKSIDAAPLIPSAHNNLALCHFHKLELQDAIRVQEHALHLSMKNVFGTCQMVMFYLAAGKDDAARKQADIAVKLIPPDASALSMQLQVLGQMRRHQDVLACFARFAGKPEPISCCYAGVAAANLERYDQAAQYLRQAGTALPGAFGAKVADYLERIVSGRGPGTLENEWLYLPATSLLPMCASCPSIGRNWEANLNSSGFKQGPFLAEFAVAMLAEGPPAREPDDEPNFHPEIQILKGVTHPRAAEVLRALTASTYSDDSRRMAAMRMLEERGDEQPGSEHRIWMHGKWRRMIVSGIDLTAEKPTGELEDPALTELFEQAVRAAQAGKTAKAEQMYRQVLMGAPDFPPACFNLAMCLLGQNKSREAEAEQLLRKAVELAPTYLFAVGGLANFLAQTGRVEEAEALLNGTKLPASTHPDAYFQYLHAQYNVATLANKPKTALTWLRMARSLAPDHPMLAGMSKTFKLLDAADKAAQVCREALAQWRSEQREQVLTPDSDLESCYRIVPESILVQMLRANGMTSAGTRNRKELRAKLCTALRDEEIVAESLAALKAEEFAALKAVLDAGGSMDFETFSRQFLVETAESGDSESQLIPYSLIDVLLECGLLVEGTFKRRHAVIVPNALKLPAILARSGGSR